MTDIVELAVPGVRGLSPYQAGKPISELEREYGVRDIIKLASNENPFGPGPRARQAIAAAAAEIRLYPDSNGFELKAALAARHDVEPARITLGNGSNDVLVLLAEAFLRPEDEAIYSRYAFAVYYLAVQATGARARVAEPNPAAHGMPLGHDLEAMAALINERTRLVFIANPNNPTGTWLHEAELRAFIERVPEHALVVVDEAYCDYVEQPDYPDVSQWLVEFPNLVVTRTFSKAHGLAGLRVGYALSDPAVADLLNRVRQPFNVNSIALAAAQASLTDTDHIAECVRINNRELAALARACDRLGLAHLPSVGNFLLVDFGRPAMPIYEALLRRALIVRPVGNYGLPNHLRITLGRPEENQRLIRCLDEIVGQSG